MPSKTVAEKNTTELESIDGFTRKELATIQTFDEALKAAEQIYGEIVTADALGDGFSVVQKSTLIDVPFLVLSWEEGKNNKYKGGFTIVRGITKDNRKILFVDGSTGIKDQLAVFQQVSGRAGGLLANFGLRVSKYVHTDEKGEETPAETYYIAENLVDSRK